MATDLIISFLSAVPPDVLGAFHTRPLTLAVPSAPVGHGHTFYADYLGKFRDGKGNLIPGLFHNAGGHGAIGRVAVIGFSNGCAEGVTQLLAGNDAQKLDFVGGFDGIHGSFIKPTHLLYPPSYANWVAFGRLAAAQPPADNGPLCVVTHSSIEPAFPSTTETGAFLWDEVLRGAPANYESSYWSELDDITYPDGGLSIPSVDTAGRGGAMPRWVWSSFNDGWYIRRVANGFSVFGWGDPGRSPMGRINAQCRDRFNNTADHVFQAKAVLPAILSTYLVPRWNDPPGQLTGFGASSASGSTGGRVYDAGPDGPLKNPFPLGVALPVKPQTCPYPAAPGHVITGATSNPCATAPDPMPPMPAQPLASQAAAAAAVAEQAKRARRLGLALLATAAAATVGAVGANMYLDRQAAQPRGRR